MICSVKLEPEGRTLWTGYALFSVVSSVSGLMYALAVFFIFLLLCCRNCFIVAFSKLISGYWTCLLPHPHQWSFKAERFYFFSVCSFLCTFKINTLFLHFILPMRKLEIQVATLEEANCNRVVLPSLLGAISTEFVLPFFSCSHGMHSMHVPVAYGALVFHLIWRSRHWAHHSHRCRWCCGCLNCFLSQKHK